MEAVANEIIAVDGVAETATVAALEVKVDFVTHYDAGVLRIHENNE